MSEQPSYSKTARLSVAVTKRTLPIPAAYVPNAALYSLPERLSLTNPSSALPSLAIPKATSQPTRNLLAALADK